MPDSDEHTIRKDEVDPPPQAPEVERRIRVRLPHAVGVTFLAAIVGLAAFGVFGESRDVTSARSSSLEMSLEYPTRYRYKQINPMRVLVTNRSGQDIDTVTVSFDTAYVARFSTVTFIPSAARAWDVELIGVKAGETRRIDVELQAEEYGRHTGTIIAFFTGSDTARADVGTFVFP